MRAARVPIRSRVAACAAATGILLLAGCAASTPTPRPAPTPVVTPTPTPVATRAPGPPDASPAPASLTPLRVDPRCAVFLDPEDLEATLGQPATAVTFLDAGLRPPPLIEISCAWRLADGSSVRLEVDDLLWDGHHALLDEAAAARPAATPLDGPGEVAFMLAGPETAMPTVAWAIRHGGADRTLRLHRFTAPDASPPTLDGLLALAARVNGDACPDLWVAHLPPARSAGPE